MILLCKKSYIHKNCKNLKFIKKLNVKKCLNKLPYLYSKIGKLNDFGIRSVDFIEIFNFSSF